MAYSRDNGLRQKFVCEQGAGPEEIDVVTEEWRYDPDGVRALKGADRLTHDGFDTADFNVVTGHGFGHTAIGRGALGLPTLRSREAASGPVKEVVIGVRSPQRVAVEAAPSSYPKILCAGAGDCRRGLPISKTAMPTSRQE